MKAIFQPLLSFAVMIFVHVFIDFSFFYAWIFFMVHVFDCHDRQRHLYVI